MDARPSRGGAQIQNPAVLEAEYLRLSDRLSRMARKGQWAGADRIYRKIQALGVSLSFRDLVVGAQVERNAGNIQATYECLREAAKIEGTREVIDWLVALDGQTGEVHLSLGQSSFQELSTSQPAFLPEHQQAVAFAQAALKERGVFIGRLPVGAYTLGQRSFEVVSGEKVVLEDLSP